MVWSKAGPADSEVLLGTAAIFRVHRYRCHSPDPRDRSRSGRARARWEEQRTDDPRAVAGNVSQHRHGHQRGTPRRRSPSTKDSRCQVHCERCSPNTGLNRRSSFRFSSCTGSWRSPSVDRDPVEPARPDSAAEVDTVDVGTDPVFGRRHVYGERDRHRSRCRCEGWTATIDRRLRRCGTVGCAGETSAQVPRGAPVARDDRQ